MDSVEKLYDRLQSEDSQTEIDEEVSKANQRLAEGVCIRQYREYPIGDQYYIDYFKDDFDEDKGRKRFYGEVARYIKDQILSEEELDTVRSEEISDAELCIDYAEVCFDAETIINIAVENTMRS